MKGSVKDLNNNSRKGKWNIGIIKPKNFLEAKKKTLQNKRTYWVLFYCTEYNKYKLYTY